MNSNKYFLPTYNLDLDYSGVNPFYACEQMMNNISVLIEVLLLDDVDTPHKEWAPLSKINRKMVEAYHTRSEKDIKYETIKKFGHDEDYHGIVHTFFVAFWATYIMNKRKNRMMVNLFQEVDEEWIDMFYSCLIHDFYRTFQEKDHDKLLRGYYPNCIEETYRHSNPLEKDTDCPLIIADRIELFRFKGFEVDESVFEGILEPQELDVIKFFYKHFRHKFQTIWDYRHEPWITHYVEDTENYDWESDIFPATVEAGLEDKICCVFTRPNIYSIDEINKDKYAFGILPIIVTESTPVDFVHEHPALRKEMMNKKEDWIFSYSIHNRFMYEMVENNLYPIRLDIITSFCYLLDQLYGNLMLNSYFESI
jgi:hypothetical protein